MDSPWVMLVACSMFGTVGILSSKVIFSTKMGDGISHVIWKEVGVIILGGGGFYVNNSYNIPAGHSKKLNGATKRVE